MRKLLWCSIKVSSQFKKITYSAKKINTPLFICFFIPSKEFQLGIIASKRVGNAVIRNRAKRLLRAAFSETYNYDRSSTVLIAKHEIVNADYKEILYWMKSTRKQKTIRDSTSEIKYSF